MYYTNITSASITSVTITHNISMYPREHRARLFIHWHYARYCWCDRDGNKGKQAMVERL